MAFPCTKCGACCRRVGMYFPNWQWLKDDGKTCAKLADDGTCTIYADRPKECRIDTLAEEWGVTDMHSWYQWHADKCNEAQLEDNMLPMYKVVVDKPQ